MQGILGSFGFPTILGRGCIFEDGNRQVSTRRVAPKCSFSTALDERAVALFRGVLVFDNNAD